MVLNRKKYDYDFIIKVNGKFIFVNLIKIVLFKFIDIFNVNINININSNEYSLIN